MPESSLVRSIVGLLFAGLLFYAAFAFGPDESKADRLESLRSSGEQRPGTVTALREVERTRRTGGRRSRRSEEYTVTCPEVTFRLRGTKHTFVEYDDCDRLAVGDEVTVLVDPESPYEARLDSAEVDNAADSSRRTTWILAGGGVLFAVGSLIGLALRISRFRARRAGQAVG